MNRLELRSWAVLPILAGALLLLYAPILLGERVLFWGLPTLQFYPWREFAFNELVNGRIPFLNPYNGAGAPLLANYQTALLYPPNWLYLFMDMAQALGVVAVLHVFWAGLGMWLFTGQMGLSSFGRGVSTLAFALGGYGIARLGSLPTSNALAWMPWVFWAVLGVMSRRSLIYMGLLALIVGLLLLTGHAQTSLYILLGAGLFALWQSGLMPKQARFSALLLAGGGVLLGLGLAAGQLLFTLELLAESQRSGGVDYETLTNLSFAPLRTINFFTPNFWGSPVDGSYLTPESGVYFEDAVYIGLLPLLAAIAALTGWIRQRNLLHLEGLKPFRSVPLWVFMIVLGYILALGRYGPFYRFLYDYVPTFDAFREPVRWMIWPTFGLAVLAGIGVQNWGRTRRTFYWTRLSTAGGVGMLILGLSVRHLMTSESDFIPVLAAAVIAFGAWLVGAGVLTLAQPDSTANLSLARWQLAVLLFIAADLGWASQGLNPTVPRQYYRDVSLAEVEGRLYWFADFEEEIKFESFFKLSDYRSARRAWPSLRQSLLPNLNMLDDLSVLNNFDPLQPRYYAAYIDLIEAQPPSLSQLLEAAGVGQVYGKVQPEGWLAVQGDYPSYRAPETPALAWIVSDAEWANSDEEIEALLSRAEWSPRESVILLREAEAPDADMLPAPMNLDSPLSQINFFEVLRDQPDLKEFQVLTDGSGYLVLAQTWYPGWSVSIDGQSQTLHRANLNFMAVELPAGGGEISFRYRPTISALGGIISFLALSLALGLIALGLIRNTQTARPS